MTRIYFLWSWALASILIAQNTVADLTEQNATICNWAQARAGVIRDTIYIDGGEMWWKVGFADGNTNLVTNNGNDQGLIYSLNFSMPFDTSTTNLTALFLSTAKAGGAANNIAPNYVDGMMFANNDEFYLYGGLLRLTDAYAPPADDAVLGYEAYQYGPYRSAWNPGFIQATTTSNVNRYVTNGAGVNVPSENLGFYFSGMRGADWGPIFKDDDSANMSANTLIEIDMSTMRAETWTNTTLPESIMPRSNAQLAWVPVSEQGALIAIGGVNPPEEIFAMGLNSTQTSQSESESPDFMTSLAVYDIATKSWYLQKTSGDPPPQLTEFCSVVASAEDGSSHNVYIYGGYDGLNAVDLPSDDVWVLSIPSFKWIKVYSGTTSHGRSGHVCTMPYPDQMFIIGGMHQDPTQCVDGIIQVFNLNTLSFQTSYLPSIWSTYKVPNTISSVIGGGPKGGATTLAAWTNTKLSSLFTTKYSKQVPHYYPYPTDFGTTSNPPSTTSSLPKWAIIVLAAALGFFFVMGVMLTWLMVRRRKLLKEHSLNGTYASNDSNRIMRWVHGMPPHRNGQAKTPSSVYSSSDINRTGSAEPIVPPPILAGRAEMSSTERFELHSESVKNKKPVEMATPYNSRENWFGGSSDIGVARGSSLYDDDQMTYQGGNNNSSSSNEKSGLVSPMSPVQTRGNSWMSSNTPVPPMTERSSSSDESSKRVSPYFTSTPRSSGYVRQSANDWESHVVSPVSEEGTFQHHR